MALMGGRRRLRRWSLLARGRSDRRLRRGARLATGEVARLAGWRFYRRPRGIWPHRLGLDLKVASRRLTWFTTIMNSTDREQWGVLLP